MHWIHEAVQWYFQQMDQIGLELYVFIGMAIESSFVPFPSEIIMPPAAHEAALAGGFARVVGLIVTGTGGSLVGAWINYFLGAWLGRPFFERYGRYFLVSHESLHKMDRFWDRYGEGSTFIARLVPAVRQLISIPAGISRMNLWKFTLFTALGSCSWVTVLALVGWFLRDWTLTDFETRLSGDMLPYLLAAVALLTVAYVVKIRLRRAT
jgi:membrane protein DedA with SNARE-associated domain